MSDAEACPSCGASLPAAFPGATVTCTCGHATTLAPVRASVAPSGREGAAAAGPPGLAPDGGGPYRGASSSSIGAAMADRVTTCPYCSNQCLSDVRQCPHCDVRFDNVRCARCYSLQPPGAFSCARCGHGLELEPLLDATDAPCPRCATPLEVAPGDDARVHECVRCGGMFVPRDALAEILTRAEVSGAMRGHAYAAWNAKHAAVTYVACPLCHASMNRVNFGRVSGIIVDVCKPHGTWFDAGELTRAVAFAASGGLDKTREREASERAREKKAVAAEHAKFVAFETKREAQDRLATWRDLLRSLFEW